ncbi:MAG: 23S rRNA (pseudouridine(1915)-N(3))-methyltransferase RlmH [Clostridiales bacterium]|nr:23S rRNA (pseudouridine(1915)-N(3))-methyltransferase RlmH [Clostridiales bacterium]
MKLMVIAVGSMKDKHFRDACAEYGKRMAIMQPVEIIEIEEEYIADEKNVSSIKKALVREGQKILSRLQTEDITVALTPEGKGMDSSEFAKMIDPAAAENASYKRCVFIIGSSHGLDQAVYDTCKRKLSFGPMTFPHQLARVMLMEQIYRGQMILRGSTYHK